MHTDLYTFFFKITLFVKMPLLSDFAQRFSAVTFGVADGATALLD